MTEILRHNSVFGPVTDPDAEAMLINDERQRQRRAIRLLTRLDGQHQDLPVIEWTVTEWSLVGQAKQTNMQDRRRAFEAWVKALGLTRHKVEKANEDGVIHLRASASDYLVNISVWADIEEAS